MTQLIRLDERAKRLNAVFVANSTAIQKMVPRTLGDPSRLLRIAFNNVAYDTALLDVAATEKGIASILGGVMEALKLGLTIGGPAQESWLVPFKEKGTPVAVLIIGYQGYRNILDRAKSVIDLHPRTVYEHDEFDVNFGSQKIHHKPYWLVGEKEPGELVAAYAIAHLARGGIQIEVMPRKEIEEHRAHSRNKDGILWTEFYDAACLKTVVRKISKYLPKSSEILIRALDLDDKADRGVPQDFDVTDFVIPPETAIKQVGHSGLEALKQAHGVVEEKTDEPKQEGPGEEALRELDATLGGPAASVPPPDDLTLRREEQRAETLERGNAEIDREIASRESGDDTPMERVGGFALTAPSPVVDNATAAVEALRRRAEEVARKRNAR